jgi:hypothetical protein
MLGTIQHKNQLLPVCRLVYVIHNLSSPQTNNYFKQNLLKQGHLQVEFKSFAKARRKVFLSSILLFFASNA